MPTFGKDAQVRLTETYKYIDKEVDKPGAQRVKDWVVNSQGHFSAASVSEALSLGFAVKMKTEEKLRHAVRATMLCRIATEKNLTDLNVASQWKDKYLKKSIVDLNAEILKFLNLLVPPVTIQPLKPSPTPKGQSYGIDMAQLSNVKLKSGGTSAPKQSSGSPKPVVTSGSTIKQAIKQFEDVSRNNVVLSGHGSWEVNSSGQFDQVVVGKLQEVRFYCAEFYPLGNDVGQLVDSNQFPAAHQVYGPGQSMPDYTLHHKDTLVLLNNSKGDTRFLTLNKGETKKMSEFLRMQEYAATTFHFAACRVAVYNGSMWCPIHNTYEPYTTNPPKPCVM